MLVYHLTNDAVRLVQSGALEDLINKLGAEEIQRIINNGDDLSATKAVERHISNFMSAESKELFEMCIAKIPKIKKLSVEWGI
jgi:hypothetical protein